MRKKHLLILDTSFKSSFCYPTEKNSDIKKHFNKAMVNIANNFDGFEGDYEFIETPFSFLEYIGGGKLLAKFSEDEKIELERCFLSSENISDIMKNVQSNEQGCDVLDKYIQQTHKRLISFFMCNVKPKLLVSDANKKLNKFSVHENVGAIESRLLDWISCLSNNGIKSPEFELLCVHLAWNMMVRHKWCELEAINTNFINRLIAFYADPRQFKYNLPGSALFCALKGLIPFEAYGELLDQSLIDLVCRGHFDIYLNKWVPVMVLSTDLKKLEERLKSYITGVKYANSRLGKNAIPFTPGFFILVDQDGLVVPNGVINIAQRIADIH